ncbi:MAG TPA: hypothetical protein VHG72_18020, partial [Polyangia bacterium]|nr:hypothetical protein [Polyangia bacterium]
APPPSPVAPPLSIVSSKFSATFYGFIEFDGIWDSTQSFNESAGNAAIAKQGTFAGSHGRTMFGIRNSRLGFKFKGPETDNIKTSAIAEMDFLGNQPQGSPSPAGSPAVSEASYFTSPTFRVRHLAFKLETPVVDVLVGQYWQLFGWQSMFHPNTVEIQGVPGQIYSRSPQIRVSKTIKTDPVTVEIALAASRPPQRDSEIPDGQAGIRLSLNGWKGMHTAGATGSAVDPLSIGFSTVGRYFNVPNLAASPTKQVSLNGYGYSVDALLPIIPATDVNHPDNALTLTGSFVYGQAIADLYTGLSGGAAFPTLPASATGAAQTYPQDVDNGLVVFTPDGVLHAIRWESFIVGAQYYLPTPTRAWISGNFSRMHSSDIAALSAASPSGTPSLAGKTFDTSYWADGNLFVDVNAAVRFGLEYAYFQQNYLDGTKGKDNRIQFSGFYIF